MARYFTSQRLVKIKPESEISHHNILTSVIVVYSTLDIFTTVVSTRGRVLTYHTLDSCNKYCIYKVKIDLGFKLYSSVQYQLNSFCILFCFLFV